MTTGWYDRVLLLALGLLVQECGHLVQLILANILDGQIEPLDIGDKRANERGQLRFTRSYVVPVLTDASDLVGNVVDVALEGVGYVGSKVFGLVLDTLVMFDEITATVEQVGQTW